MAFVSSTRSHAARTAGSFGTRPCTYKRSPTLARQSVVSLAHKDADVSTKDWRAQRMTENVHKFYDRLTSRGEMTLADELLADNFVQRDSIWYPQKPIVGAKAYKAYLNALREAYPDLQYEIEQVGALAA